VRTVEECLQAIGEWGSHARRFTPDQTRLQGATEPPVAGAPRDRRDLNRRAGKHQGGVSSSFPSVIGGGETHPTQMIRVDGVLVVAGNVLGLRAGVELCPSVSYGFSKRGRESTFRSTRTASERRRGRRPAHSSRSSSARAKRS